MNSNTSFSKEISVLIFILTLIGKSYENFQFYPYYCQHAVLCCIPVSHFSGSASQENYEYFCSVGIAIGVQH